MDTENWASKIDQVSDEVEKEFGRLSSKQLNWKPDVQTWSIAQNLDHLIIINESYYPIIHAVRQGTYKTPLTGKMGFLVKILGNTVLKSVQPDRQKRMKTIRIWEPAQATIESDIVSRFEKHQNELKQMIAGCHDLLDKGTVISSPANRHIVYKLETTFDIIVAHEQRHLGQAKRILQIQEQERTL